MVSQRNQQNGLLRKSAKWSSKEINKMLFQENQQNGLSRKSEKLSSKETSKMVYQGNQQKGLSRKSTKCSSKEISKKLSQGNQSSQSSSSTLPTSLYYHDIMKPTSIVGIVMIAIINGSCIAIKNVDQIQRMQTLHGSITRPLVSKSGSSARQFSVKIKCIVLSLPRGGMYWVEHQ